MDLKKTEGKKIFLKLAETAEVIVENYSSGVVQRLGIDYEHIRRTNQKIVYCSISGFGKLVAGSQPERKAYNAVVMGEAGLLSHYDVDTLKPNNPSKPQISYVDIGTAMNAAISILAALVVRAKMGRGQYVEAEMIDTAMCWREDMVIFDTGSTDGYLLIGPDRPFRAAEGWITITCVTEVQFQNLFVTLGLADLLNDPEIKMFNLRPNLEKYLEFMPKVENAIAKKLSKNSLSS